MSTDKDICRICIQEVNDCEDAEDIDLGKLRNLIKTNVLPKWKPDDFKNHIICGTCITNCRTVQSLYRHVRSSNGTLCNFQKDPQKFKKLNKFDFRLAPRFKDVPPELEICRCCSEATQPHQVAIYLYNNDINLLPVTHIEKMLKTIGVSLKSLDQTLNPIMCCTCWQRVQVSYAFRARLNLVTEKVQHYRRLLQTTYETRNDLQDIVIMWPNLAKPEPLEEENDDDDDMPIIDVCTDEIVNSKLDRGPELAVKLDQMKNSHIKVYLEKYDLRVTEDVISNNKEMPLLTAEIDSEESKKTNIRKSNRKKTAPVRNDESRKPIVRTPIARRTRSSIKNLSFTSQDDQDSDFNDLLMVTKEEIIKPYRRQKKRKPVLKPVETAPEILTDAKDLSIQYTFERWNFNEGIVSDVDDEFVESTGPLNNSNENCPIISPEPQAILDLDDYDDSPPELELQGPCDPGFMSKPYSVDEKRVDAHLQKESQQEGCPKKVGLTVRTDLLQPRTMPELSEPPKIVEPLRINLSTMEVSNKPPPAKTVKIHSNEVIVPKYRLRNSDMEYQNYFPQQVQKPPAATSAPPPLTPLPQSKPKPNNEEFKLGDRLVMNFNNRPVKRQGASEDGGSLLKRPKITENSNNQQPAETNGIRDKLATNNNQLSTGTNRISLLKAQSKNPSTSTNQKPGTSGTGSNTNNSVITNNRKYQFLSSGISTQVTMNNSQPTRMSLTTQKIPPTILAPSTNSAGAQKVPIPPRNSAPLGMPKLTINHNQEAPQKIGNNPTTPIMVVNNLPPNLTNFAPNPAQSNSPNPNYPLVQKIMFLETGEMVLVDQNVVSESQATSEQKIVLQKVAPKTSPNSKQVFFRKLVPNMSKVTVPESQQVVQNSAKPSTSAAVRIHKPKIVVSEFILISSDDEEGSNLPPASIDKTK